MAIRFFKNKSLIVSNKSDMHKNPPLYLNNQEIEEVSSYKYLGLIFTNNLKWSKHVEYVSLKAHKRLGLIVFTLNNLGSHKFDQ